MLAKPVMKRALALVMVCLIAVGSAACARKPEPKSAANKIRSYLIKYGKKYPNTPYGTNPVKEVDVIDQEEIHKNLVSTQAYVTMGNGDMQKIRATLERRLRWKIISWERLL